jgi:hypothetical protein
MRLQVHPYSEHLRVYSVSHEERSVFWEVVLTVTLSKKCICARALFRAVSEIELFHRTVADLLIRKRYYLLFLISVFVVQMTKLYSLHSTIHFRKFHRQHQCILQLVGGYGVFIVEVNLDIPICGR